MYIKFIIKPNMTTTLRAEITAEMYRAEGGPISPSTVVAYTSLLNSVGKQLSIPNVTGFKGKKDQIVSHVKATRKSPQTRKSIFSGLLKVTGDKDYLALIREEARLVKAQYAKKETKEGRPVVTMAQLEQVVQHYKDLYAANPTSEFHLQNYLMVMCTSGVFFPVRRSLDWIEMRMAQEETGNYVDWATKQFVLRVYKNADRKGTQSIDIPPQVYSILKKLHKMRQSGLVFLKSTNGSPYTSSEWTKKLNSLYGVLGLRKISTDVLRSTTATHHGAKMVESLENLAKRMGTSVSMLSNVYIKSNNVK
jgi:integrase